jgi:hypothetical protein
MMGEIDMVDTKKDQNEEKTLFSTTEDRFDEYQSRVSSAADLEEQLSPRTEQAISILKDEIPPAKIAVTPDFKERRFSEVNKVLSVYNAMHGSLVVNTFLESYVSALKEKLNNYEVQKQQPQRSSMLRFFSTWGFSSRKVHPEQPLKTLSPDQLAEFTVAKQMLDHIKDYITSQKTLDLVHKAISNVAREPGFEVFYITASDKPGEGEKYDTESSVKMAIKALKKGQPLPASWNCEVNGNPGIIKDKKILSILSESLGDLQSFESDLSINLPGGKTLAEGMFITTIERAYQQHKSSGANNDENKVAYGFDRLARTKGMLASLSKEEYSKFIVDLKKGLVKLDGPTTPEPEQQKGHRRRQAWG